MPFGLSITGIPRRRRLGFCLVGALVFAALFAWLVEGGRNGRRIDSLHASAAPAPGAPLGLGGKVGPSALTRDWTLSPAGQQLVVALQLQEPDRSRAIAEALEALAKSPAEAITAGRQLLSQEPQNAESFGTILIGALTRAGEFSAAFELASTAGPPSSRVEWMSLILGPWVRREPGVGPELAGILVRQGVEGKVYLSLVQGWAESAPEKLADFALTLPAGENRTTAFDAALDRWILRDPMSAAQWMASNLRDTPEFDRALSTLLARTDDLFASTETALEWTEGIDDPNLRLRALTHVLQQWALRDPTSALRYAQTTPAVDPEQRETLISSLTPKSAAD